MMLLLHALPLGPGQGCKDTGEGGHKGILQKPLFFCLDLCLDLANRDLSRQKPPRLPLPLGAELLLTLTKRSARGTRGLCSLEWSASSGSTAGCLPGSKRSRVRK